jgi:hypothetical protein
MMTKLSDKALDLEPIEWDAAVRSILGFSSEWALPPVNPDRIDLWLE